MDEVQAIVSNARLGGFLAGLRRIGVEELADLVELTSEDLESLGMNQLQKRRFARQVVAVIQDNTVAPQPAAVTSGSGFAAQRPARRRPHASGRAVTDAAVPVVATTQAPGSGAATQRGGSHEHVFDAAVTDGMSSTRALRTLLSSPAAATPSAPAAPRSGVSWALDHVRTPTVPSDAAGSGGGDGASAIGNASGGAEHSSPDTAHLGDVSDNDEEEESAGAGHTDTSRGHASGDGAHRAAASHATARSDGGGASGSDSSSLGGESVVVVDPDAPPLLPSSFGTQEVVVAPPPEPEWQEVPDGNGYLYYHHKPSGKVQWEVPPAAYTSVTGGLVTPPAATPSLLPDRTHVEELAVKEMLKSTAIAGHGGGGYLNRHRQMGSPRHRVSPTHRSGSPPRNRRKRVGSPDHRQSRGQQGGGFGGDPTTGGLGGVRPHPVDTVSGAAGAGVFNATPQNGGASSRLTTSSYNTTARSSKRTPGSSKTGKRSGKGKAKGKGKEAHLSPREAWNNSLRPGRRAGNPLAGTATRKIGYDLDLHGTEQGRWRSTWQEVVKMSSPANAHGSEPAGPAVSDGSDAGEGASPRPAAPQSASKRPSRAAPRLPRTYSGRKVAPGTLVAVPDPHEAAGVGSAKAVARRQHRMKWTESLRGSAMKATEAPKPHSTREAYLAMLAEAKAVEAANAAAASRARSDRSQDGGSSGQRTPTSRSSKGKARRRRKPTVFDRLTDVRSFTGTHRERFDASTGRGQGLAGRERVELDLDDLQKELPTTPLPLPVDGPFQPKNMRYFKF